MFIRKSLQNLRHGGSQNTVREEENFHESMYEYTFEPEINKYIQSYDQHEFESYPGVETIDYDYAAERKNMYTTNLCESTAHMIKSCLGVGILGIHEAFMYGGLWTSLGATVIIGVVAACPMLMLIGSAQKIYVRARIPSLTYPDLAEIAAATGPFAICRKHSKIIRYTLDCLLLIQQSISCCIYQIAIAKTLKLICETIQPTISLMDFHLGIYVLITFIPIMMLCLIRTFKYLAPVSVLANLFFAGCVSACMYYGMREAVNIKERPAWKSMYGFIRFSGVCIYSIDGLPLAMPIENNMKNPKYFGTVVLYGMVTVVTIVSSVGFFGYWGWGENCQTPVTVHMPMSTTVIFLQLFLMMMMATTFALHFWVPFRIMWRYTGRTFKRKRVWWERLFRVVGVLLITAFASLFPNLVTLMSFIGSVMMSMVTFLYPAFIEILVTWREQRGHKFKWVLFKDIVVVFFGLTMCIAGLYSTIPIEHYYPYGNI